MAVVVLELGETLTVISSLNTSEAEIKISHNAGGSLSINVDDRTIFDEEEASTFGGVDNPADAPTHRLNPPAAEEPAPRALGAAATGERDMTDLSPQTEYRGDRELYTTKP